MWNGRFTWCMPPNGYQKTTQNRGGVVREAISDMPTADLKKVGDMPPCNAKELLATM